MSQINDAILAATGGPTVPDGLRSFYESFGISGGALRDMEYAFLRGQGQPAAQAQDMWYNMLLSMGYANEAIAGTFLQLTAGAGSGQAYFPLSGTTGSQSRQVSAYDGISKVAAVQPRWAQNLSPYSDDFSNPYWFKSGGFYVVTPNIGVAPDGTQTADFLKPSQVGAYVRGVNTGAIAGQTLNASIYAKSESLAHNISFSIMVEGDLPSGVSGTLAINPNTWTRLVISGVAAAGATNYGLAIQNLVNTDGVYLWRGRLELAADDTFTDIKTTTPGSFLLDNTTSYAIVNSDGLVTSTGNATAGSATSLTLSGVNFAGALDDMLLQWWSDGAPVGPPVDFSVDFTSGSAQPVIETLLALPFAAYPESRLVAPTYARASPAQHTQPNGDVVQAGNGELRFAGMTRTLLAAAGAAPYYHGAMVPYIKYVPNFSAAEGALLERYGINYVLYSNNPGHSGYWGSNNISFSPVSESPMPGAGAVELEVIASSVGLIAQQLAGVNFSVTPGVLSFYFKPIVGWRTVRGTFYDAALTQAVDFRTETNTALILAGDGTNVAAGMEEYANGYWRCWMTCNLPASGVESISISEPAGIAGSKAIVWGVQVEQEIRPSSLIITDNQAVSRAKDQLYYSEGGASVSGEATLFTEFVPFVYRDAHTVSCLSQDVSSDYNRLQLILSPSPSGYGYVLNAGAILYDSTPLGIAPLTVNKGAVTAKAGAQRGAYNGVLGAVGANALPPPSVRYTLVGAVTTLDSSAFTCRKISARSAWINDAQLIAETAP